MSLSVKYLLYNRERLRSSLRKLHLKQQAWWYTLVIPALEREREREIPVAFWQGSLIELAMTVRGHVYKYNRYSPRNRSQVAIWPSHVHPHT